MQDYVSGVAPKPAEQPVSTPQSPDVERAVPDAPAAGAVRVTAPKRDESKPKVQAKESRTLEEYAEMLRKVNMTFDLFEIAAEYTVQEDPHQIIVVIRNTHTGEVIRRVPPDDFVANYNDIKRGLGALVNESV